MKHIACPGRYSPNYSSLMVS